MPHSDEILELLRQYGELHQKDLSSYVVYGSPCRPLSSSWVSIPHAVLMTADKAATGYYNYVAVPVRLDRETRDSYELNLVSRP